MDGCVTLVSCCAFLAACCSTLAMAVALLPCLAAQRALSLSEMVPSAYRQPAAALKHAQVKTQMLLPGTRDSEHAWTKRCANSAEYQTER